VQVETASLVRQLTDVDVARLLLPLTESLGPSPDPDFAEVVQQWLPEWEQKYMVEVAGLSMRIRSVHSKRGYQQRAARFSRINDYRRAALDNLYLALVSNSRREIDRWEWALFGYLEAIALFATDEELRQQNTMLKAQATASFDLPSSAYPVLHALLKMKETQTRERDPVEEPSAIRRGVLIRMLEYQQELRKRIDEEHELVRRRDELYASLPPELRKSPQVDATAKLRSLQNQIYRYHRLIGDSRRLEGQRNVLVKLHEFDAEIIRVTHSRESPASVKA
jgi:hypothetical protein